jgi:hypothetical protein
LRHPGPHSRPTGLTKLDGRTREAKLLMQVRGELMKHIGGAPNAAQRLLIEQAAQMSLRIAMMDAKTAEGRELTPHDSRVYLAWSNSLSKTLRHLGLKGAAERGPDLATYLASKAKAAAA